MTSVVEIYRRISEPIRYRRASLQCNTTIYFYNGRRRNAHVTAALHVDSCSRGSTSWPGRFHRETPDRQSRFQTSKDRGWSNSRAPYDRAYAAYQWAGLATRGEWPWQRVWCPARSDRVPGYLKRVGRCGERTQGRSALSVACKRTLTFLSACTVASSRRRSFRAGKTACRPPLCASFHHRQCCVHWATRE